MKSIFFVLALLALTACASPTSSTSSSTTTTATAPTGVVTTLAGSSTWVPLGVVTDGTNLYVADSANNMIYKIVIASGVVTTLAGSTTAGSDDGTGTAATFNGPFGLASDGTNLYVADSNTNLIRKIVIATGVVTTLAGSGATGVDDGTGTAATFDSPGGLATDGTNVYVADNVSGLIRKIVISSGVVTTLAGSTSGSGSADGVGTAASFSNVIGLATDGTNLYVTDSGSIRKIVLATAEVSTLAGSLTTTGSADGTGAAARFNRPYGVATDGTNLYVADRSNNMIRKIVVSSGVVTTLAGSTTRGSADGTGTAARFYYPSAIAVSVSDPSRLFVCDYHYGTIRMIR